jgi:hypothetical protein
MAKNEANKIGNASQALATLLTVRVWIKGGAPLGLDAEMLDSLSEELEQIGEEIDTRFAEIEKELTEEEGV